MHGYLMHVKLYNKVQSKLEMINYKEGREKRVTKAAEEEIPKAVEEKEVEMDERFGIMKDNPEFKVDRLS